MRGRRSIEAVTCIKDASLGLKGHAVGKGTTLNVMRDGRCIEAVKCAKDALPGL
jgi:hypothetical protein